MGGATVQAEALDTAGTTLVTPQPRSGPDHCPTTTEMHQAVDGLIARLRLPGGRMTPAQARAIAEVAAAGDSIELTSRGNLQLRGLDADVAGAAVARLAAAGLTPSPAHDRARTIAASPLLGRASIATPDGAPWQTTPRRADAASPLFPGAQRNDARVGITDAFVAAFDEAIRALESTQTVSGRVLTVVDDGTGHALAGQADLLVRWDADDAAVRLVIGGLEAGIAFLADAPHQAAALLGALGEACAEASVWRARELPAETLAQLARAAGGSGHPADAPAAGGSGHPTAAPAASGSTNHSAPDAKVPAGTTVAALPVGVVAQADGRDAVRVLAPLGRLTAMQLAGAADLAGRAATDLRIDDRRGLTLVDLPPATRESATTRSDARSIASVLSVLGLITDAASPAIGLTACAGAACTRTSVDVRAAARLRLAERRPGDGREHLVGCARQCGAPRDGTTIVAEPADTPAELAARAARVRRTPGAESSAGFGRVGSAEPHLPPTGPEAAR